RCSRLPSSSPSGVFLTLLRPRSHRNPSRLPQQPLPQRRVNHLRIKHHLPTRTHRVTTVREPISPLYPLRISKPCPREARRQRQPRIPIAAIRFSPSFET